ncbi:MAG: DMT family transporter [Geminicoccaceae bacterium]
MTLTIREVAAGSLSRGVGYIVAAWFLFALHDASIKLLVADLSAWQVLFVRSLVVLSVCLLLRRRSEPASAVPREARGRLLVNAQVYAFAWIAYYTAARDLQLAELETVYYASPVITTVLAAILLRERVALSRWSGLAIGFLGVLLACAPTGLADPMAVGLALIGAVLWAYSVVLIRELSASVSTPVQMLTNNTVFLVLCAITVPWWWDLPTGRELLLLMLVGITGLAAQHLLYEGLRCAPASLAAPLEYTGLLWAFALGFLIWNDVPSTTVLLGAALIVVSGAVLIFGEWRGRLLPGELPESAPMSHAATQVPVAG